MINFALIVVLVLVALTVGAPVAFHALSSAPQLLSKATDSVPRHRDGEEGGRVIKEIVTVARSDRVVVSHLLLGVTN